MRAIKKSNSTNKMHLLRILLLTASTLIVTACSNGPSSSEAEKAVKKTFLGGCSQIEMKEFTKTNGIQVSDRNYKVEAKYSVRLPSTSARQAHIQEALAALKKADAELQTANAVSQKYKNDLDAFTQSGGSISEFEMQNKSRFYEMVNAERLISAYEEMKKNGPSRVRDLLQSELRKECPRVSNEVLQAFFNPNVALESYSDALTREFTGAIHMIKTDNGWEERR